MAAVACAGAVGAAKAMQLQALPFGSCSVAASQSVAFRGAAVAVRPLRVFRRGQCDDGVEYLQRKMERLSVKASAEDGEGEVTLNKPMGSSKKVTGAQRAAGGECGDPRGPTTVVVLVKCSSPMRGCRHHLVMKQRRGYFYEVGMRQMRH